jgi:glycosyltransferase involved in cell wall biosynthesis
VATSVTVAIPTRNAGPGFRETLEAVRAQRIDRAVQLLICDSGSSDDTRALARAYDADMIEIAPEAFSHGGTRNLLMSRAAGDHVAFLTQDAVPAAEDWLTRLLAGFGMASEVGLVFGPYLPRPGASVSVARELTAWFDSFTIDGPRVDVLPLADRNAPARHFLGHLGFFTDANGCVSRAAWEQVPFRHVAYAEDHLLAQDMLRAGYAKVYVPEAAVIHSHEYSAWQWVRRSFDEARAVREIYGWAPPVGAALQTLRGNVAADWRESRRCTAFGASALVQSALHHGARTVGGLLGGRAENLPGRVSSRLSLERRS